MAWHPTWNEPPERRRRIMMGGGGTFPPGVKMVLLVTLAVFVVDLFTRGALSRYGSLSVRHLLGFEVWRLFTYMFLHGSFGHIFINMFIFWMIGMTLERQLGTRRFLYLYFAAGLVGGLLEVAFNVIMHVEHGPIQTPQGMLTFLDIPAVGASAGVAGVMVAFATINPRAIFLLFFFLPIQARWLAIIYMIIETRHMLIGLQTGWTDGVAHAAHVGGMIVGFVWVKWGHRIAEAVKNGRPRRDRGPFFSRGRNRDREELDRILDKIHREGVGSLSTREKMFLQEMGGKFRDGP
ncbi:MAG: rhomboid family intramembrane serine protease [Phycisphaerae bacterium]